LGHLVLLGLAVHQGWLESLETLDHLVQLVLGVNQEALDKLVHKVK